MNLNVDDNVPIEIIRTKRKKTASIKISKGLIKVIVPEQLSDIKVKLLIDNRRAWILKKLNEQSTIIQPKPKQYISGESLSYLGKNYKLKVVVDNCDEVRLINGYIVVKLSKKATDQKIKNLLLKWYKNKALEKLTEKTNKYAKTMGLNVNSIFVKDYKARWGSCYPDKRISYNWRIIIAPHHIVDYVVFHELCHILHPNHSPSYWKSVETVCPDFSVHRKWLREHESELINY